LIAVVSSADEAGAAVHAGADMVDLGAATPPEIMAVRARFPGVGVCAGGAPADVVMDVAAALATGAMAICAGVEAARVSGLEASRLLIAVPPALVPPARESGWAALVDVDQAAAQAQRSGSGVHLDETGSDAGSSEHDAAVLAIAALASWLGAAAVRTRLPGPVRRALDMTASVRGLRPPARAVRGLA
jgi:dihydropteroate synthase